MAAMMKTKSASSEQAVAIAAMFLALTVAALPAFAQTASVPGAVLGMESFAHVVQDLEKSIPFYRDVLGLEVAQPLTTFTTIPWVNAVGDTPGAQIRIANFRFPGSPLIFELVEYKDIDRKPPVKPRYQDPGVTTLVLYVRDMDEMIAKIKKTNAKIITVGGKPSTSKFGNDTVSDLFIQDPDGFYIGLSLHSPLPATAAPASSNVLGESLEFVVGDMDRTLRIYKDILGFAFPRSSPFIFMEAINEGGNTPGARIRTTNGPIPGRSDPIFGALRYMEYKDINRTPLRTRLQDPGTTVVRLSVRDLAATVKDLQGADVSINTKGAEPVTMGSSHYLMFRDSNNMYVDLVQHDSKAQ